MRASEKLEAIKPNFNKLGFYTTDDIIRSHKGHFFSPDTMRFFRSRVLSYLYCGKRNVYFVTSEKKCFDDFTRVFNVRRYNPNEDSFETLESFYTSKAAKTCALNHAYDENKR